MKTTTVVLAVLSAFSGAASAASGVTLYGKVEAAYQGANTHSRTYSSPGVCPTGMTCIQGFPSYDYSSSQRAFKQGAEGESRIGIKGNEDLGNGTAAFFQLESKINADTGSISGDDFFGEKSIVGLSFGNGQHRVYFGKSDAPLERIDLSTQHLSSGLDWQSSAQKWKNAAFYDYTANGLSVMAAVTTKGGMTGNSPEGVSGTKPAYGVALKYEGSNFAVAAGYQRDNGNGVTACIGICPSPNAPIDSAYKSEWGVGAQYTFNPITISASYADAKLFNASKERRLHSTISAKLTSSDTVFVNFLRDKSTNQNVAYSNTKTHFGLGYVHALSKRTEIFANVGREKTRAKNVSVSSTYNYRTTYTAYDFGLRHSF